jgi:tripartite-type tricarboxylate transporter receptor subunit TctC
MRNWSRLARLLSCFTLFAASAAQAQAQAWPAKPVRMLVPYPPGGGPDVVARIVGQRLSEVFGQQFVVENRPGAGGISAAELAAKSPADGYLLFFSDIQQLAINPHLFSRLPYDPTRDFAPVTLAVTMPLYVVAQPSLQVNSLADLVALAKARPGKLSYGSSGIGSIHHIAMESLKSALGIDIVHVPYKGAGQSVPAFIAGDVSLVVSALPALAPYVKTGQAKLLAVTTLRRAMHAPEVPAVSELVPGYDFSSEMGVVVPAGTAPAIVAKLSTEIAQALRQGDTVQRLHTLGLIPLGTTPEGYSENIRGNLEKFSKAVRISGARAE